MEAFAEGRAAIEEFGLRRQRVYLRTRRWYATSALPWTPSGARGRGTPVDVEREVTPAPKVRSLDVRMVAMSGGRFQTGDVQVSRITPYVPGGNGVELSDFTAPVVNADEERHVLIVERGGTAWHVREGGARLLHTAATAEASAPALANALRTALLVHWSDVEAHAAADTTTLPAVATGTPSAITLANAMRAAWITHRASLVFHRAVDETPLAAPVATDAATLLVLLADLLRAYNAHAATGAVSECTVVQGNSNRAFEHSLVVRPTRRTP